jgi:hypothetical protein
MKIKYRLGDSTTDGKFRNKTVLLTDIRAEDPNVFTNKILSVIAPLKGFYQLRILIHGESIDLGNRRKKEVLWRSEIGKWHTKKKRKFAIDLFYDVYGTSTGCCEDWFKNIWLAFQNEDVERIVYLPYDVVYMDPKVNKSKADPRLQHFINEMNESSIDLLLGTYEISAKNTDCGSKAGSGPSLEIRKSILEAYTVSKIWQFFPESMDWFYGHRNNSQRNPIPRTGFFGLSRSLFEKFIQRRHRPTMLPWTGTVQLLVCAILFNRLREKEGKDQKKFKIAEKFVANLKHPAESFMNYDYRHQLRRIAFVIEDEADYWSEQVRELGL